MDIILIFFLGLCLGSFSSALIYRIPRGMDWVSKRSFCTSCDKPLGIIDLVPLFSWLMRGGKCACCETKISVRYPILEIAHAVIAMASYLCLGITPELFFILAALPFLMSLLVIDLDSMILPNILVLLVGVIGVIRLCFQTLIVPISPDYLALISGLGAGVAYCLFSYLLGALVSKMLHKEALGFGDVKFFFVAGLWLGLGVMPYFLILSGVVGVVFALCWKKFMKNDLFPFGPSLIVSFYLLILMPAINVL